MSATVAHHAVVAGEGARADELEHAETVGQGPGLRFVEPHERGVQAELFVHGQIERDVETLDEVVAAVWVAREVGLSHAGDEIEDAALTRIDGGDAEEEEIAPGHEGVGRTAGGFVGVHLEGGVGEGVAAELAEERHIHHFIGHLLFGADFGGDVYLVGVFLSVGEAQGVHFVETLQCPKEAGGGVLSAAEHHEGAAG